MDIILPDTADNASIVDALHQCTEEDAVCCNSDRLFKAAKLLLVKERISNVTIQLLDEDGYAIKQVTSKKKGESSAPSDQLNGRQVAVIRALEKVLQHCRKEKIQLVGYSDELVALPAHIPQDQVSSVAALDVDTHNVYRGADAIIPSDKALI